MIWRDRSNEKRQKNRCKEYFQHAMVSSYEQQFRREVFQWLWIDRERRSAATQTHMDPNSLPDY